MTFPMTGGWRATSKPLLRRMTLPSTELPTELPVARLPRMLTPHLLPVMTLPPTVLPEAELRATPSRPLSVILLPCTTLLLAPTIALPPKIWTPTRRLPEITLPWPAWPMTLPDEELMNTPSVPLLWIWLLRTRFFVLVTPKIWTPTPRSSTAL